MIRPEIAAALRRWRGAILAAAGGAAALLLLGPAALRGAPLAILSLAIALPVAAALFRDALIRARLRPRHGPGIVEVREGAVAYFGPETGGAVALDEVAALALAPSRDGPVWRIDAADRTLAIPTGAEGAGALLDAFAALPGFDAARVGAALRGARRRPVAVWRRPEPDRLRLR